MEKLLQAPFELPARQEHSPAATLARQPNVGAKANDAPVASPARMRLLEPHHVANGKRNWLRAHHERRQ
jgi:hypothetical protein